MFNVRSFSRILYILCDIEPDLPPNENTLLLLINVSISRRRTEAEFPSCDSWSYLEMKQRSSCKMSSWYRSRTINVCMQRAGRELALSCLHLFSLRFLSAVCLVCPHSALLHFHRGMRWPRGRPGRWYRRYSKCWAPILRAPGPGLNIYSGHRAPSSVGQDHAPHYHKG